METLTLVELGSLSDGDTFLCPWKEEGKNAGKIRNRGVGSVGVHVPNQDSDGWEETRWSPATQVVPCEPELYNRQGFGATGGRDVNRSEAESPVKLVHRICTEMIPNAANVTKEQRKAAMDECIKQGVNPNTAKTQYYHWRKANR